MISGIKGLNDFESTISTMNLEADMLVYFEMEL